MKLNENRNIFSMQLQYFADGEGGEEGGVAGASIEPITFASQSEFDSALDKHLGKALLTAKTKWEEEAQIAINEAKTEGQKMAQMTAEQQAKYEEEQRSAKLAERESEITRRELRAHSLELLAGKSLPKELVDIVVLTDAEACTKSIAAVEQAFSSAVQKAVDERLAVSAENLPGGAGSGGSLTFKTGSVGKRLAENNLKGQQQKSAFFKN